MSPDSQARTAARAEAMLLEMQLQELRKARSVPRLETPDPTDSILTARSLEMGSSCGDVYRSLPPALLPRIDDGLPGRSECADITGSHRQPVGVRHGCNAGIIALNGYACISCSRQNVSVGRGA